MFAAQHFACREQTRRAVCQQGRKRMGINPLKNGVPGKAVQEHLLRVGKLEKSHFRSEVSQALYSNNDNHSRFY
jgi:hypothetical protein